MKLIIHALAFNDDSNLGVDDKLHVTAFCRCNYSLRCLYLNSAFAIPSWNHLQIISVEFWCPALRNNWFQGMFSILPWYAIYLTWFRLSINQIVGFLIGSVPKPCIVPANLRPQYLWWIWPVSEKNCLLFHKGIKIQDGCQSWLLIAATKLFVLYFWLFEATSIAINTTKQAGLHPNIYFHNKLWC